MKRQFTNYNDLVDEVKLCEAMTAKANLPPNTEARLMGVISALGLAAETKGSERFEYVTEAAIRIFCLMAMRGIDICAMDNQVLNIAPKVFAPKEKGDFKAYLYDLVATLTYRRREDCDVLELLKLWERGGHSEEMLDALTDALGEKDEDNADMWSVHGFENFMLNRKLCCVLSSLSSFLRAETDHDLNWHVRMRIYRNQLN